MDAYEASRIVFTRIQCMEPDNASKIVGYLLLQDRGEQEMIRLAFSPDSSFKSLIEKAKRDLGFLGNPGIVGSSSSDATYFLPANVSTPPTTASPFAPRVGTQHISHATTSALSPHAPPWGTHKSSSSSMPLTPNKNSNNFPVADPNSFLLELQKQQQQQQAQLQYQFGNPVPTRSLPCQIPDECIDGSWKTCVYYAKGYCKNGSSCRFMHLSPSSPDVILESNTAAPNLVGRSVGSLDKEDSNLRDFLRSKRSSATPNSQVCLPQFPKQRFIASSGGDDTLRLARYKGEVDSPSSATPTQSNSGSRQIYLTFPAESTFKEEDVSNYFSIFGPVQDVRIPYQQRRMFGFVTFVYQETVNIILAKGNPHYVCDSRVLVKPYKEKVSKPIERKHVDARQNWLVDNFHNLASEDFSSAHFEPQKYWDGSGMATTTRQLAEEQAQLEHAIEMQSKRLAELQLSGINNLKLYSHPNLRHQQSFNSANGESTLSEEENIHTEEINNSVMAEQFGYLLQELDNETNCEDQQQESSRPMRHDGLLVTNGAMRM